MPEAELDKNDYCDTSLVLRNLVCNEDINWAPIQTYRGTIKNISPIAG